MALLVVGLNHKTVSLATLEQLTLVPGDLPKALARLVDFDAIHEGVILSTCNRIEVYASAQRFHPAVQSVRRFLSDVSGIAQDRVSDGMYVFYDDSAVRHLFQVASGADSMIVGEPQILGQVRDAYALARAEGTARRTLTALFERALRVGKRARTQTNIARHVVSIPAAAARMADEVAGGLRGRSVVVVGAGRMGELAARACADMGCASLVVANRTPERAARLAAKLGVHHASLEALSELFAAADVVISTTSAPDVVVGLPTLERAAAERSSPLVVVDVALPRDVDPAARQLPGVRLLDLEDLSERVASGTRSRERELPKVGRIVDDEVLSFCAWQRSLALEPAIVALREWAEARRAAEVARAVKRHRLGETGREALDAATRALVNKLLHVPTTRIKELASAADGQVFLEAFQELFDLDVPLD